MGQEISGGAFSDEERAEFRARLREETKILKGWFDARAFDYDEGFTGGLEVEGWLIDKDCRPAAENVAFLDTLAHPLVTAELSRFNFEINTDPFTLDRHFLSSARNALEDLWGACARHAEGMGLGILAVGSLPTVRDDMLQPEAMSPSNRYAALTQEVFRLRNSMPVKIAIAGEEFIELSCEHIMVEAACTSMQVHLKVNQDEAKRFYNASQIIAGPLVACSANSPFLYGRSLWAESRIPAFEQAASVFGFRDRHGHNMSRVTLGADYVRRSLLELFLENLDGYPVLLPALCETKRETLPHLRLQNGTIWRWNRPVLGFADGVPHLRIEQRVTPAGPTHADMVANMALNIGLALALARRDTPPEEALSYTDAHANFYACARRGLEAEVTWLDGRKVDVQQLLLSTLLPMARRALDELGVDKGDLDYYFDDVLARRLLTGRTGAEWQRNFIHLHGPDFQRLTEQYARFQESGDPVHTWTC